MRTPTAATRKRAGEAPTRSAAIVGAMAEPCRDGSHCKACTYATWANPVLLSRRTDHEQSPHRSPQEARSRNCLAFQGQNCPAQGRDLDRPVLQVAAQAV